MRPQPVNTAVYSGAAPQSDIQPGGVQTNRPISNPSHGKAYDLAEGQRLYGWYNCSGCHANGGGGIGPPLIKDNWIYGGQPENLYDTIVKGRPNGMPTWGKRIPSYQIWQIVTYVESLNGKQPASIVAARQDAIEMDPGTIQNKVHGETK